MFVLSERDITRGDFLHEIGADRTIDFATEDWADERDSFAASDLERDVVERLVTVEALAEVLDRQDRWHATS